MNRVIRFVARRHRGHGHWKRWFLIDLDADQRVPLKDPRVLKSRSICAPTITLDLSALPPGRYLLGTGRPGPNATRYFFDITENGEPVMNPRDNDEGKNTSPSSRGP